jgi:hypothetical protein
MRKLQTALPVSGNERSSGSRVRFPVMITRLMLAPAMLRLLSQGRFESFSRVYGRARRQPPRSAEFGENVAQLAQAA